MGGLLEAAKRRSRKRAETVAFQCKTVGKAVVDSWLSAASRHARSLGVVPGMTVMDVDPNDGRNAIPLAALVGQLGTVYALNESKERSESLARRASRAHLQNLVAAVGRLADTGLPSGVVQLIRVPERLLGPPPHDAVLKELHRVAAPRALLVLDQVSKAAQRAGALVLSASDCWQGWVRVGERPGQILFRRDDQRLLRNDASPSRA